MRLPGVRGQDDQLVGQREAEGGRPRARHRLAAFPQLPRVERRHPLRRALEPVMQLEHQGRNLVVGQHGVVAVGATGAHDPPPGRAEDPECTLVIATGEQEVDVLHRAQPRRGIAGRHGGPLEDHWFEAGVGQRAHGQGHRPGDEKERLHPEGVRQSAEGGAIRAQRVAAVGGAEGPPQQRGDPVVGSGGHGAVDVGPAGEGTPERGRIGITAAGLPEHSGRRLGRRHRGRGRSGAGAAGSACGRGRPHVWGTVVPGCACGASRRGRIPTEIAEFGRQGGRKSGVLALSVHCARPSAGGTER